MRFCIFVRSKSRKMNLAQIQYYQNKLSYEMDPSDLFQALGHQENIIVIDTRQAHGFEKEHIPGAMHLPHREMNEATTQHLDPSKTYVCYCDGIGCNASTKGALQMARLGFTVRELVGGLVWWKLDGYATEGKEAKQGLAFSCAC